MKKLLAVFLFSLFCFQGCASVDFHRKKGASDSLHKQPSSMPEKTTISRGKTTQSGRESAIADERTADAVKENEGGQVVIRIGLLINVASFNLSGDDYIISSQVNPSERFRIKGKSDDYFVSVGRSSGGKIIIDGREYTLPVSISGFDSKKAAIRINGKGYRGRIIVNGSKDRRIIVINEIDIEDYLKGVLPSEMSPSWHIEALKSQAVAARSFALKNMNRHQRDGFDLCSTVHCQVYTGIVGEKDTTTKAVEETRGEVLRDASSGDIANTVFHACCGGYTEEPVNVWDLGTAQPAYLIPHECHYCRDYPHFNWSSVLEADFIRERLNQSGWKVGNIKKIEIAGRNISGRVRFFKIIHSKGTLAIPAGKFRLAVDPWKIKSTKISTLVRHKNGAFEFRGRGWGHGVGMCQAGAKGMAEKGKRYRDILSFYYKGAILGSIYPQ